MRLPKISRTARREAARARHIEFRDRYPIPGSSYTGAPAPAIARTPPTTHPASGCPASAVRPPITVASVRRTREPQRFKPDGGKPKGYPERAGRSNR
jgi:hypothetical protein